MSAGLKITGRDRVFMLFAPTIALAAAYLFLVARPMSSETASLRRRCAELGPAEDLADARPGLEARLAKAREESAAADAAEPAGHGDDASVPSEPADRMRVLRELFRGHGCNVVSSSIGDVKPQFGQTPPVFSTLLERVAGSVPNRWLFEVEAGYAGMAAALDELSGGLPCVVDSLSMEPAKDGASPCKWRLVIWM